MSTLSSPPGPPRPRRRMGWPRLSRNGETRSVQIGVVATILFHLLLILALPHLLKRTAVTSPGPKGDRVFTVELEPEETPKVAATPTPPPKPFKFVEINPDAPDNPPDKTENFGAQNQQVAQEKPTPDGKSDAPALAGDKEKESTAIVTGRLKELEPPVPPTPPTAEEQQAAEEAAAKAQTLAQAPLPGFEKFEGESPDSVGSNIAKLPPPGSKRSNEVVDGDSEVREVVSFNGQVIRIDPRRPAQRERVEQRNSRPAFLRDNQLGTQNIGPIAYNAKWSEYGAYLQKLIETVQVQWEKIIEQGSVYPPAGTIVRVKFSINDKGEITDIAPDEGESPLQAKRASVSAITARAPYGRWSDEMIAVLGREQEMTFTFYYNP